MIFSEDFIQELQQKALEVLKLSIPASSLRQYLQASYSQKGDSHTITVHIPQYWAPYYHYGSGPITMPGKRFMVWFKNPKDDPRLRRGYPIKRSDIKRLKLSRSEFTRLLKEGKIIVRQHVGRRKANPFTEGAYRKWGPWIHMRLLEKFYEEINDMLDPLRSLFEI